MAIEEEPTTFASSGYPPFPQSKEYPTVELEAVTLQKLLDHDASEEDRVFEACNTGGFFYLRLTDSELGRRMLQQANEIARVGELTMSLPEEGKAKFGLRNKELFG